MVRHPLLIPVLTASLPVLALPAMAREVRTEKVEAVAATAGFILSGRIKSDDTAEYTVSCAARQKLSVDTLSNNGGQNVKITPKGMAKALFMGATSGTVADVTLPAVGDDAGQVFLMRSTARRDEAASETLGIGLATGDFAGGLTGGPNGWKVTLEPGSSLTTHSFQDAHDPVQSRELAQNRGCRMTGGDRGCNVRPQRSGQQGWVAGHFLTEAAVPTKAEVPAGGLGNAGVWIALGDGRERAILFKGGVPVSADWPEALSFEKVNNHFTVRVVAESHEIVKAVVFGG